MKLESWISNNNVIEVNINGIIQRLFYMCKQVLIKQNRRVVGKCEQIEDITRVYQTSLRISWPTLQHVTWDTRKTALWYYIRGKTENQHSRLKVKLFWNPRMKH